MNTEYCCPRCKLSIEIHVNKLFCNNCKKSYFNKNGYIDFIEEIFFDENQFTKEKLKEILQEINKHGYEKTIIQFSNDPIIKSFLSDIKSADSIFHCIGKNNLRCLEIGSNLGKISDNLSHIFHGVYSIETSKEKIEIQKKRFQHLKLDNITILRCNPIELPFPDNYFDLVICNESFGLSKMFNPKLEPKKTQIVFLKEIKRVLTNEGCLCLGVQNKFGIPKLFGIDNTDYHTQKNNKNKISNYTLFGYHKLLKNVSFNFKSYWVLPSCQKPYFSGNLKNDVTSKWFFQNATNFLLKRKKSKYKNLLFALINKLNKHIIKIILSVFVPDFVFCCYKSDLTESVEDTIIRHTKIENFLMMGRRTKIFFVLLEQNGKPVKKVVLDRYSHSFPNKIGKCDRIFPNMKDPIERMWIEDWIDGIPMDPTKIDEMYNALEWLHRFQKESSNGTITKDSEELEIRRMKYALSMIKDLDFIEWKKWLKEYESYIEKHTIYKTAVHGDFWSSNILINPKTRKVNVIDWEMYEQCGNPIIDNLTFIFFFMITSSSDILNSFKSSFNDREKYETIIKLQKKISEYFGFEFKLVLLLRWLIIKQITDSKLLGNGARINLGIKMLEFLKDRE